MRVRALVVAIAALGAQALLAAPALAGGDGEGLVGETNDKVVTLFSLGLVVFFILAVTVGTLLQGASTSYTCTTGALSASFTNIASVTGHPPVGPDVTASDNAPVTVTTPPAPPVVVTHPAISITKSPPTQTVTTGLTVTFTIVVTNTGDVTLTNVTVTDALSPGCARTKTDIPALASMAPGATVTYQCTSAAVTASFTNVAIATGTPPTGSNVTASASAAVVAQAPLQPAPKPSVAVKPTVVSHRKPKATG